MSTTEHTDLRSDSFREPDLWGDTVPGARPDVSPTTAMPAISPPVETSPTGEPPADRAERRALLPLVAPIVATVLLVAAVAFVLVRRGDDGGAATAPTASAATTPAASVPVVEPIEPVEPVERAAAPIAADVVAAPVPAPDPLPAAPSPDDVDAPEQPAVDVPPVAPTPDGPVVTPPPPPPPPAPAPVLAVQDGYELDPGVLGVTVTIQNTGDAALDYEIVNDGDGFTADSPVGGIEPGSHVDVWVDLHATAEGDGPTPILQVVEISSNGGDAAVTISGQVEKPGHLIAAFESIPLVDYRATLSFTNVGGLPLDIVAVDAPGLRLGLVPDAIAAGETVEIDVAICADGPALPVFVPLPNPNPMLPPVQFQVGSWVTVETDANGATTGVNGVTQGFDPPSCQPVIGPVVGELVFAP